MVERLLVGLDWTEQYIYANHLHIMIDIDECSVILISV